MKTQIFSILLLFHLVPVLLFAQKEKPSRVIVLCDVSSSITGKADKNSPQISVMKSRCKAILKHYPEKSDISFYIISSNVATMPFLRYHPEEIEVTNQAFVLKEIKKIGHQIDISIDSA